jgi:hypothetical protein
MDPETAMGLTISARGHAGSACGYAGTRHGIFYFLVGPHPHSLMPLHASVKRLRAGMAAGAAVLLLVAAPAALAGDRYAIIITGASGGEAYAQKYDKWRLSFVTTLREKFHYPEDRIIVLADADGAGVVKATRENVRRVLGDLRKRTTKDDQLLVLLIGHGTSLDGEDAKFNLVGPDLSASEWADLLKPIPGTLVFVDTTSGSFPFLRKLAGRGRVVLTSTDSAAQQFETVFPEFFLKAFDDPAADIDKNGRVSMWEAFSYASAGVRQWFEQRGRLATERPLLDDTGAGIGREAQNPGTDGAVARLTYLEAAAAPAAGDTALSALLKRKADLEAQIESLKTRKDTIPPDQYDAELEKLLVELARVSQQIRTKS